MTKQATCAERIEGQWAGRAEDFRALAAASDIEDIEELHPDTLKLCRDLGIDAEDADTIREQAYDRADEMPLAVTLARMVRVEMSTGGPADWLEYALDSDGDVTRVEYVFQDWFDGARMTLEGDDFDAAVRYFEMIVPNVDNLT